MIDFDKLPEFTGFTVYNRESGEPVLPQYDEAQYVLSQNGNLYEAICAIKEFQKVSTSFNLEMENVLDGEAVHKSSLQGVSGESA